MRKKALLLMVLVSLVTLSAFSSEPPEKNSGSATSQGKELEYKRMAINSDRLGHRSVSTAAVRSFNPVLSDDGTPTMLRPRQKKRMSVTDNMSGDVPQIYGNVVYSSNDEIIDGVYEIPSSESMDFILKFPGSWGLGGCVLHDGIYYTHRLDSEGYTESCTGYDWETGKVVYDTDIKRAAISMGMADYKGTVYGIFCNRRNDGYRLGTCEYTEDGPEVTEIAVLPGRGWQAFAVDGSGQGWGVCASWSDDWYEDAKLYKIDLETGATQEIGELGITSEYRTAMAFERTTNRLFYTVTIMDHSYLTELNTSTGKATIIYEFPGNEQVTGLHIPELPGPDAPPMPQNLTVDFPFGKLTGNVTFLAPATLNDGTPASGELAYSVVLPDGSVSTGTTTHGATVSVQATVPCSGWYDISAVLTNDAGSSPIAKLHAYIGAGVPETPQVQLNRTQDQVMNVTWDPITATVEGGYIDPKSLTYDVVRYPDGKTVAEGISETKFSETLIGPEDGMLTYYYTVKGHNSDVVSAEGKSNGIVVGNGWKVPYAYDFNDPYNYQFYTVLDANGDNETWKLIDDHLFLQIPRDAPADDWVVTPPIYLEAGKVYSFSFDAKVMSKWSPSRYEVKWGAAPTVESMTETAMSPVTVTEEIEYTPYYGRMIPTESGYYYIGVHNISEKYNFYSYLDNFAVTEAEDVPSAPTDLVVEPGEQAALIANISFVTPDKTIRGVPIQGFERIVVEMDGKTIYEVSGLKPGVKLSCFAQPETDGEYTISVRAYITVDGKELEGDESTQTVYVGIDYPLAPQGLVMTEPEPGKVRLDWEPVTKDVKGVTLPETKYIAYRFKGNTTWGTLPIDEIFHVRECLKPGEQDMIQLGVSAVSKRGEGEKSYIYGFAGTPYKDYRESFVDGKLSHNMAIAKIKGFTDESPAWVLCDDATIEGIKSSDEDNGYIVLSAYYAEEAASLMLGKMDLSDFKEPVFTYYTYNIEGLQNPDDENLIEVYAREFGPGHEYALVSSKKVCDTGARESWNKVVTDLSAYKGKTIEIMINCTTANMALTMLDALRVADKVGKDLSVSFYAPQSAKPGDEITLIAKVRNEADTDAGAYTMKFYDKDNVTFLSEDFESLICGASTQVKVHYKVSEVEDEPLSFAAEVIYDGDENTDNNLSAPAVVNPVVSRWPEPLDLRGEVTGNGIGLSWNAPDLVTIRTENLTETFEDGETGSFSFGDWTFVDGDGLPLGGIGGADVPGIEPGETCGAYVVFDSSLPQFTPAFEPYSGTKYLASFFTYEPAQKDDWAISPLLSGHEQNVWFNARSLMADYPESFEVYYSTGSLDPADFILIEDAGDNAVYFEWSEYDFDLPEGAKYFAIRSNSYDQFVFMIDDVNYTAGYDYSGLTLEGYNVYRNGVKLNDVQVKDREYLDAEALPQDNVYTVTAVYKEGESRGADNIRVSASGVGEVAAGLKVSTVPGRIIVEGAADRAVSIHGIDGITVADSLTGDRIVVEVSTGCYLVHVGDKSFKIMVK